MKLTSFPSCTAYLPAPYGPQASVPKSLGVTHCGGCGAKCFYAADGVRLMRCRACKAAWYCSEACAKLDYQSHKVPQGGLADAMRRGEGK